MTDMRSVGRHALLDAYGCTTELLRDARALESVLLAAAAQAGARVLHAHFHTFGGAGGVTGVVVLAESHISIHTWPECGLAAVDVFLCGTVSPDVVCETVAQALGAERYDVVLCERGGDGLQAT